MARTRIIDPSALPQDFVEFGTADGVLVDLRYASTDNFTGRAVYDGFDRLLLHRIAAGKLATAVRLLASEQPALRLLILDGFRPNRVQRIFWELVRGTPHQPFVADPAHGSIHSFGLAVDLTLADASGRELDMGTPFDDFSPLAEPRLETLNLASGALTEGQIADRRLLRHVMTEAGFLAIPIEWWHFDALAPDLVRARFPIVE